MFHWFEKRTPTIFPIRKDGFAGGRKHKSNFSEVRISSFAFVLETKAKGRG